MSFVQAQFWSPMLQKQVGLYAILPEVGRPPFPVFYLLHGLSDDHTIWHRRTRIEYYVRELPFIVVMPDGFRGFYTDNEEGPPYGRYMTQDVIGYVERNFPAQRKRAARCIGGLSMGGYGCIRLALAHPELYASASSHSGAFYPYREDPKHPNAEFRRIFGRRAAGTTHDPFHLAKQCRTRGRVPQMRIDCGVDDSLIQHNRDFHAHLVKLGIAHEYEEFTGSHEWGYWDLHIREALRFHARVLELRCDEALARLG
jgi:putative tributyrin esterase